MVAPAGSAAQPNGVVHIRSDSARTNDRTGTGRCLTKGFQIIGASSTIQVHDLFSRNVGQPARNSSSFAYRANGPECRAARGCKTEGALAQRAPEKIRHRLRSRTCTAKVRMARGPYAEGAPGRLGARWA